MYRSCYFLSDTNQYWVLKMHSVLACHYQCRVLKLHIPGHNLAVCLIHFEIYKAVTSIFLQTIMALRR